MRKSLLLCFIVLCLPHAYSQRTTLMLNGTWEIEESVKPNDKPRKYTHTVQVPGLVRNASPSFPDVDMYHSREYLGAMVWFKKMEGGSWLDSLKDGRSLQERNYFWYRTTFNPGDRNEVALLKVNKAQFGTMIWFNGKKVAEYNACFNSATIDVTKHVLWHSQNEIIIRIGAHPGVLSYTMPWGTDPEKTMWTPGIYDDVAFIACKNPCVEQVQVATDYVKGTVKYELKLKNYSHTKKVVSLINTVRPWKKAEIVARGLPQTFLMESGETKILTEEIKILNPRLWSPDSPNLYMLETKTDGDSVATRFGIREFRFDTKTKKAYLNGKIFYMRGTNITLHRFFEDSLCGSLPWNDDWIRKLLVDIPKQLNWNSMRFCIGPVPNKWLDIADEAGLLIQNEFFIWGYRNYWDKQELTSQIKGWVLDNCNHPSVVIWDICNETNSEVLGYEILPEVRKTDLSKRPWENGYFLPHDENDPVNDHHYFFYWKSQNDERFDWNYNKYEKWVGEKSTNSPHPTAHSVILNEYGWLWLHRDGTPTSLTEPAFKNIAPNYTNDERIEKAAFLLGLETEYFRAHRNYAAVMHFTYLTGDHKDAFTCDLFKDIKKLEFHQPYEKYLMEAFQPLGVYLNFTRDSLSIKPEWAFSVMMVNDYYETKTGRVEVAIYNRDGSLFTKESKLFSLSELSAHTYKITVKLPQTVDKYIVKATAYPENNGRVVTSVRPLNLIQE